MSPLGWTVVSAAMFVAGGWLVWTGWRQPRPALAATVQRLHRVPRVGDEPTDGFAAIGARVGVPERAAAWRTSLRLLGRTPETHVGMLVTAAVIGLLVPSIVAAVLQLTGIAAFNPGVPAIVSLAAAAVAPMLVHAEAMGRAGDVLIDVRYQLSAYLDMVTMLLAGNTGHEGALQQAAQAGDGLLFRELRRRMREVGATGQSLVEALALVADDYGLVELEQVAATTSLSASQGAPVARTLAAKCSTLRGTIAAEQEADARVRTDKVTPPLVGMALLFMALIIYPALSLN